MIHQYVTEQHQTGLGFRLVDSGVSVVHHMMVWVLLGGQMGAMRGLAAIPGLYHSWPTQLSQEAPVKREADMEKAKVPEHRKTFFFLSLSFSQFHCLHFLNTVDDFAEGSFWKG